MSAARRLLLVLLLPALLLAQSAGLLHRIAHAPHGEAVHPHGEAVHVGAGHHAAGELFASHDDGDVTCRLFDQLAGGDAAPLPCAALPSAAPSAFVLLLLQGLALARWAALYDARGPPAFR